MMAATFSRHSTPAMNPAFRLCALTLSAALLLAACGGGGGGGSAATNAPTPGSTNNRATTTDNGSTTTGTGGTTTPTTGSSDGILADLQPYIEPVAPAVASAPYAAALADCTFTTQRTTPCTLNQLPFIGIASSGAVTVDDVMARVITSRPWMAQRLRELLQTLPPDLLRMMQPVTAIVVASKVRPSLYWAVTGALYIDPAYLWTTPAELADVDKTPDYRTDFGDALQFASLWRYVKDNDYAYRWYPLTYTGTRSIEDIKLPFASLMLHELAHAGDFAPPRMLTILTRNIPLPDALGLDANQSISSTLYRSNPLRSSTWYGLAGVLYDGNTPTLQQRALTAADVSAEFSVDRATDDYAYASQQEDVAMLAEEALMRLYFNVSRDFAITAKPALDNPTAADFRITWGTRGRIGQPLAKQAAAQVVSQLLPGLGLEPRILALPAPVPLPAGSTWQGSLALGASAAPAAGVTERMQSLGAGRPVEADIRKPY
jgi:hypothetical protein